jgi:hypothetical protein
VRYLRRACAATGALSWTPLKTATVNAFFSIAEVTPDPTRGVVVFRFFDCALQLAEGVTFEADTADAGSVVAYFDENGLPDLSLKKTTAVGEAAIANLVVGPTLVTTRLGNGEIVDQRKLHVRAGALSSTYWSPLNPQAAW